MDTAKTLFQSIGIPRQVVVYHQMRALKVDAFASSIRSDQDAHPDILLEELFCFSPFITEHSAVDGNNSIVIPEDDGNSGFNMEGDFEGLDGEPVIGG